MIRLWVSIMLLASSLSAVFAADGADLDLSKFESSVSYSRYVEDLSGKKVRIYNSNNERYYPTDAEYTILHRGFCLAERLHEAVGLREDLGFPFEVMKDRLHYTPETVWEQQQISLELEPDQVVFMRNSRLVPKNVYKGPFGPKYIEEIDEKSPYYRRITAAMWTVSGQVLSLEPLPVAERMIPNNPHIRATDLPWMKQPIRADFMKTFKRSDYGYMSEWGKAANILSGDMAPLYSSAVAADYQRVKALGLKVEDAWVSVEVDPDENPTNAKAYRRTFPGTEVSPGLFIIPLEKMMEKWKPQKYLHRVDAIVKLSGGKLSDAEALNLFNEHKLLLWDELNFKAPSGQDQGRPIVFHDFTGFASAYSQDQIFNRYGIPAENRPALEKYLMQFRQKLGQMNSSSMDGKPQYADGSDVALWKPLSNLHAIEISNLNGKLAAEDPQYSKAALLSSYSFYIKKFYGGKFASAQQLAHLIQNMHIGNVHFAMTTSDPAIIKQMQLLNPVKTIVEQVPQPIDFSIFNHPGRMPMFIPETYKPMYSFVFSIQQISDMIGRDPAFFQAHCLNGVHDGVIRANYLLNEHDHF